MSCANNAGTITCDVGTLPANASASAVIVVKTPTPGDIIDTAILVANQAEINTYNNNPTLLTTVRGTADLAIGQIDSPDPVLVGSNLTYTISVTNKGPWGARGTTATGAN